MLFRTPQASWVLVLLKFMANRPFQARVLGREWLMCQQLENDPRQALTPESCGSTCWIHGEVLLRAGDVSSV